MFSNNCKNLIIIDEANLFWAKNYLSIDTESRINFQNLIILLTGSNWKNNTRCILVGRRRRNPSNNFYEALEKIGIELMLPEEDLIRGDKWDDNIINNLLESKLENSEIENIFLISGDSDFLQNLNHINRSKNINITIVSILDTTNQEMQKNFNFINLADYKDFILYQANEKRDKEKDHLLYQIDGKGSTIQQLIQKITELLKAVPLISNIDKLIIEIDL